MKLIFIFLLISVPSSIFCKNIEYETTDEVISEGSHRRQDCAKNELRLVLEKFLEEFSKQVTKIETKQEEFPKLLAKIETKHLEEKNVLKSELAKLEIKLEDLAKVQIKHSNELTISETKHLEEMNVMKSKLAKAETQHLVEKNVLKSELKKLETKLEDLAKVQIKHSDELAKIGTKHSEEVNAVKLEFAEVKVKQSEKMAEVNRLKYDVEKAKNYCSEEVKSTKIELIDVREELSKKVEEEHEIVQDEFVEVRKELSNYKIENAEEFQTIKERIGDAKTELIEEFSEKVKEEHEIVQDEFVEVRNELSNYKIENAQEFETIKGEIGDATSNIGFSCVVTGSVKDSGKITYGNCPLNEENMVDPSSGVFVAPKDGIYFFTFFTEIVNVNGASLQTYLVKEPKNGASVYLGSIYNRFSVSNDIRSSHSLSVLAKLEKGDKVYMKKGDSDAYILGSSSEKLAMFSGFSIN